MTRLSRAAPIAGKHVGMHLSSVVFVGAVFFGCTSFVSAQSCLTRDDINQMLRRVETPTPVTLNKKLEVELVKIADTYQHELSEIVAADEKKKEELRAKFRERNNLGVTRFCEILKQNGWPTRELIEEAGVKATFQILRTMAPFELQRDLLPVVVAVLKKDESQKSEFAGLLDRLRISAGMKQLFGTQAVVINGFLMLYPIEDEEHVDARRKQYGLPPIDDNKRFLERKYMIPLVKAREIPDSQMPGGLRKSVSDAVKSAVLDTPSLSADDVIRTNTNLVSMNVSVFSNKLKKFVGELKQEDFHILEDGQPQEISFFASTDMPFDLVLLIDLSGSTSGKRDLIRKSTQRFIEAARPTDRIAIVTFADSQTVASPLTDDRSKLLAAAHEISGSGGSKVWDALKFTLDNVVGPRSLERRKAIVMMTDGADNAMSFFGGAGIGSTISFADLLDAVGKSDTLVVPIYLDTESDSFSNDFNKKVYANARKMLQTLASESGGSYYTAKKVADLNGVYEQVINDLGKIYSLGYKPTNDKRDATWRNVEVQMVNRPDLSAHAKPGYYAK